MWMVGPNPNRCAQGLRDRQRLIRHRRRPAAENDEWIRIGFQFLPKLSEANLAQIVMTKSWFVIRAIRKLLTALLEKPRHEIPVKRVVRRSAQRQVVRLRQSCYQM